MATERVPRRTFTDEAGHDGRVAIVRHRDNGPLHDLLLKACPPNDKNEKSITILAGLLGIKPWAIHKWVKKGKLPAGRAIEISDLSGNRVMLEAFKPFI